MNTGEKIPDNAQKLFKRRNMIIQAFKDGSFRLFEEIGNSEFDLEFGSEFDSESYSEYDLEKPEQKFDESIGKKVKLRRQKSNEFNELIVENDKIIDKELFRRYFGYKRLAEMDTDLYKTRDISLNETKANLIQDKLDSFKKMPLTI